jgi:hypothetical protein
LKGQKVSLLGAVPYVGSSPAAALLLWLHRLFMLLLLGSSNMLHRAP